MLHSTELSIHFSPAGTLQSPFSASYSENTHTQKRHTAIDHALPGYLRRTLTDPVNTPCNIRFFPPLSCRFLHFGGNFLQSSCRVTAGLRQSFAELLNTLLKFRSNPASDTNTYPPPLFIFFIAKQQFKETPPPSEKKPKPPIVV